MGSADGSIKTLQKINDNAYKFYLSHILCADLKPYMENQDEVELRVQYGHNYIWDYELLCNHSILIEHLQFQESLVARHPNFSTCSYVQLYIVQKWRKHYIIINMNVNYKIVPFVNTHLLLNASFKAPSAWVFVLTTLSFEAIELRLRTSSL